MRRPLPPRKLITPGSQFEPSPRLAAWITATFVDASGPLYLERYGVLGQASLGCLWTNVEIVRGGKLLQGTAEIPVPRQGAPWVKARARWQIEQWFGAETPDFVLTFYAPWAAEARNAEWCALVEHELSHCGQAVDEYGAPRFDQRSGRPIWAVTPHDVEEFGHVVARYGAEAVGTEVARFAQAARGKAELGRREIAAACGRS